QQWQSLIREHETGPLVAALSGYLTGQRWFQGKARTVRDIGITDLLPVAMGSSLHRIALVNVSYVHEAPETYVVPLAFVEDNAAQSLMDAHPEAVIAEVGDDHPAIVADALFVQEFRDALLDAAHSRRRIRGRAGDLQGSATGQLRRIAGDMEDRQSRILGAEQSNTSIVFGRNIVLKVYRRLDEGTSLDVELGEFLGAHGFPHTPAVLGSISYLRENAPPRTLAV